jgi:uncharacterized protein YndB with AHSA1/START domain
MTEAKRVEETKKERRFETEIVVDAPVQEVWKALTDAKEFVKWFPLEARVTPGQGGKIFLSWGPDCEGEAEIVKWEPERAFAWKEQLALIEWTLEQRGGKTFVRLVQSAFAGNSDWENEWSDSTSYGWGLMLLGLQVALERHRGIDRQVAWPRLKVNLSREEAYRKLMSAGSVFAVDAEAALKPEQKYSLKTTTGEVYSGRVEFVRAQRGFCVSVREMNDALLWLTIEGVSGKIEAQLWLSAFCLGQTEVDAFERKWQRQLENILT